MVGDWEERIENYQQIKENNSEAFKLRNPIIYWRHFYGELGIEGLLIICLFALMLLLFFKKLGWFK